MAASATDKVFDELGKMTVLELVELQSHKLKSPPKPKLKLRLKRRTTNGR